MVEVTDSAVLGAVAEVVSSNPTVGHKYFSAYTGILIKRSNLEQLTHNKVQNNGRFVL